MDSAIVTALAEPNRLRIVELLGVAPRSVGEIAAVLQLRQPQVTKHLQTLERAGLVTLHPLGQRRIAALRRERLRELAAWADELTEPGPSEGVLEQYRAAIDAERAALAQTHGVPADRTVAIDRRIPAAPPDVWRAWTIADRVRRWWAPDHFTVADCTVVPAAGGPLRIVLEEGDGTRHRAEGRFVALEPPTTLRFELAPLAADDTPLFRSTSDVRLSGRDGATDLHLSIAVIDAAPAAVAALAGMRLGWEQSLAKLARLLEESPEGERTRPGG
jgi:uncharacterized protein YndB with AHSA1/START domain/DNA-binding transcriptional ArsR family regulator